MSQEQRLRSPKYTETRVLANLRSDLSDLKRDVGILESSPSRPSGESPLRPSTPPKDYRFGGAGGVGDRGGGYVRVLDIEEGNTDDDDGEDEEGREISLQESSNVILLYRLQSLRLKSFANFLLAVFALLFSGLNVVMVVLNAKNKNDDDCYHGYRHKPVESVFVPRCGSPVSVWTFHIVEFTGTFVFSVVQAFALLCSPAPQLGRWGRREVGAASVADSPFAFKVVLVMSVVLNAIPALLIWFSIEAFEVPAHEIEYANEITMSFIDLMFFVAIVRAQSKKASRSSSLKDGDATSAATVGMVQRGAGMGIFMAIFAATIAMFQLYIYNGMGVTKDGKPVGEKPAHYCEFAFEIISALVTFFFCIDSKFVIDREIDAIMFGDAEADAEERVLEAADKDKKKPSRRSRSKHRDRKQPSSAQKKKGAVVKVKKSKSASGRGD